MEPGKLGNALFDARFSSPSFERLSIELDIAANESLALSVVKKTFLLVTCVRLYLEWQRSCFVCSHH